MFIVQSSDDCSGACAVFIVQTSDDWSACAVFIVQSSGNCVGLVQSIDACGGSSTEY